MSENAYSAISLSFLTFRWSIVHDKETTWWKLRGRRSKVKVMSRQHRRNCCRAFSPLFFDECQWNLAGIETLLRPFSPWIFKSIDQKSRSQSDKTENPISARICKLHGIVKIIAQYTLHTSCHRDNKPRHVQSMSLDVSTNNSVDGPSQVTIQVEGRPPCRVPLQVQF